MSWAVDKLCHISLLLFPEPVAQKTDPKDSSDDVSERSTRTPSTSVQHCTPITHPIRSVASCVLSVPSRVFRATGPLTLPGVTAVARTDGDPSLFRRVLDPVGKAVSLPLTMGRWAIAGCQDAIVSVPRRGNRLAHAFLDPATALVRSSHLDSWTCSVIQTHVVPVWVLVRSNRTVSMCTARAEFCVSLGARVARRLPYARKVENAVRSSFTWLWTSPWWMEMFGLSERGVEQVKVECCRVDLIENSELNKCRDLLGAQCFKLEEDNHRIALRCALLENILRERKSNGEEPASEFWNAPVAEDVADLMTDVKVRETVSRRPDTSSANPEVTTCDLRDAETEAKVKFVRLASSMLDEPGADENLRPSRSWLFWETDVGIDDLMQVAATPSVPLESSEPKPESVDDRLAATCENIHEFMRQFNANAQEVADLKHSIVALLSKRKGNGSTLMGPLRQYQDGVRSRTELRKSLRRAVDELSIMSIASDNAEHWKEQLSRFHAFMSTTVILQNDQRNIGTFIPSRASRVILKQPDDIPFIVDDLVSSSGADNEKLRAEVTEMLEELSSLPRQVSERTSAPAPSPPAGADRQPVLLVSSEVPALVEVPRHESEAVKSQPVSLQNMDAVAEKIHRTIVKRTRFDMVPMTEMQTLSSGHANTSEETKEQCKFLLAERQRTKEVREKLLQRSELLDRIVEVEREKSCNRYFIGETSPTASPVKSRAPCDKSTMWWESNLPLDAFLAAHGSELDVQEQPVGTKRAVRYISMRSNASMSPDEPGSVEFNRTNSSKSSLFWDTDLPVDELLARNQKKPQYVYMGTKSQSNLEAGTQKSNYLEPPLATYGHSKSTMWYLDPSPEAHKKHRRAPGTESDRSPSGVGYSPTVSQRSGLFCNADLPLNEGLAREVPQPACNDDYQEYYIGEDERERKMLLRSRSRAFWSSNVSIDDLMVMNTMELNQLDSPAPPEEVWQKHDPAETFVADAA